MALVRPFAAYRYASDELDITQLTSPPYDVVSDAERSQLLAADSHNVVALELPSGPGDPTLPENRYQLAGALWDVWREQGVLVRDAEPAIYVLEQRFYLDGSPVRRRAFIAEVMLEPFEAGVVLPHERTLPKALGDRFELIKTTGANLSQVLGLFEDPDNRTGSLFEAATAGEPLAKATDADGVESVVWAATDPALARALEAALADRRIFIADGHHRYTTALAYRDLRRGIAEEARDDAPDPAYDFVMMALVNMEDPELVVMPTHRVADAPAGLGFSPQAFYEALARTFVVEAPGDSELDLAHALAAVEAPAFLVRTKQDERPRLARLRDDIDLDSAMPLDRSDAWKHLDVAVLQELVLSPLLNIHPDRPQTVERLSFVKDMSGAIASVSDHDVAFMLRPTRMDQLRAVATAGETMPQKSTYFYPKLLSGLVFRSAE